MGLFEEHGRGVHLVPYRGCSFAGSFRMVRGLPFLICALSSSPVQREPSGSMLVTRTRCVFWSLDHFSEIAPCSPSRALSYSHVLTHSSGRRT